ncbi:MAG: polyphenol oxidase family protein [Proteobacteria bacterium]|nr:polyphenol oxidase family protein [Pseudomonadota bacterium]
MKVSVTLEKEEGQVPVYRFPALSALEGVSHGLFSREGGRSRGTFAALNLGSRVGDDPRAVDENRRRAAGVLGARQVAWLRQVHGARVVAVEAMEGQEGWFCAGEGDALMTDRPGLFLAVLTADCQGILLADPVRRAVAAVHSGWRGSVADVAAGAVREMVRQYGCRPRDLVAGIGPSLGPCCAQFVNYREEIPRPLWKYRIKEDRFDFWAMTRDQLAGAGVLPENVQDPGICTRCSPDRFFSYRAEKVTGRFAAVVGLSG